jgi:hypothetical protein
MRVARSGWHGRRTEAPTLADPLPPHAPHVHEALLPASMGFSKKLSNLAAAVAIQAAYYNFCWRLRKKGTTG